MTKEELISRLEGLEWEDFEVKEARAEVEKAIYSGIQELLKLRAEDTEEMGAWRKFFNDL